MSDRRSQRIRQQLRQHPNPRGRHDPGAFHVQIRRVYQPVGEPPTAADQHAQLARQLESQRKSRR